MKLRRWRLRLAMACGMLLVTLLGGCGPAPSPQPSTPPAKLPWTGMLADVRTVWSAEPGIDLLTAPAVTVRAYLESIYLADYGGDIAYAYPGFAQAVPPNAPEGHPHSTRDRWPDTQHPIGIPVVGTRGYHILRVDEIDRQVTAVVCVWAYTTALDLGHGKYGWMHETAFTAPSSGIGMQWVSMTAPQGGTGSPLPVQKGTAPAPVDDVFGAWRIDGALIIDASPTRITEFPEWPTRPADAQSCVEKAPDPLERRLFLSNGVHPRSDFPTLPPFPGWPAAGAL
ncbi:hypothetical protein [Mycobacterium marinum]|uniref:hypothetical protein n=1 Tax=Mycobacterium marinum TaxID=1781 RepID=UPI0023587FBE|nr:hypothetical protein [Mycobacterium marinum]MDC8984044.1 hypothetical protein [Mycobacterium marinum]MDC9001118.1 hypothetical protein [Mycobacterium marinum]MDC9011406.1 hypothetical protein [Mycobacterium marinum]MDC9016987.1 hypothetical protein [Mycobacterium marinum]